MLLAELNVRHTRRHMPTRRVALGDTYLPLSGAAAGAVLLGAVVAEHLADLDEEQRDLLPRLVEDARSGLSVPRIALRYRLQTDTHGLDRSRHRIVSEAGSSHRPAAMVLELDRHAAGTPQLIGAVMAAATLPTTPRRVALRAVEAAIDHPALPEGLVIRRLYEGVPGLQPFAPRAGYGPEADRWRGVPAERRWAMEVLGLRAGTPVERHDIQARFRRLVRLAHPDHGAARDGAAERLAEIREARELLLAVAETLPGSAGAERAG